MRQENHDVSQCMGLICECPEGDIDDAHGTLVEPCKNAACYHCGWGGSFPAPTKGLQAWERRAMAAGWTPPPDHAIIGRR